MKKIITIIGLILVIVVSILYVTQIKFAISGKICEVKCISWDATYESVVASAEAADNKNLPSDVIAYSYDNSLPSENPNDYMNIYVYCDVKSSSIQKYNLKMSLSSAEKYKENILFISEQPVGADTDRFGKDNMYIILDVYIGNLNDEQIKELVRGLDVKIKGYGEFVGKSETNVSFDKCDKIKIERKLTGE